MTLRVMMGHRDAFLRDMDGVGVFDAGDGRRWLVRGQPCEYIQLLVFAVSCGLAVLMNYYMIPVARRGPGQRGG